LQKLKTHIKPDGKLDIPEEQLKNLVGKDIEIIVHEKESDFIETIKHGPKIKMDNDNLDREFLHRVDKNDNLYR
jgi:hypothetical protein